MEEQQRLTLTVDLVDRGRTTTTAPAGPHSPTAVGFALLFPEQQRSNDPNLCFNWFMPGDSRRDLGEPLSIRQMIDTLARSQRSDPRRIFVTGLSAGGAMAAIMLATYPELFAGGAIIAGLPYGCAKTVPNAFDRMKGSGLEDGNSPPCAMRPTIRLADHLRLAWDRRSDRPSRQCGSDPKTMALGS